MKFDKFPPEDSEIVTHIPVQAFRVPDYAGPGDLWVLGKNLYVKYFEPGKADPVMLKISKHVKDKRGKR